MSAETSTTPNPLSWRLLRNLRTALPMRSKTYVSKRAQKVLEAIAARSLSQPEFVFFQLAVALATLSKKAFINKGPNFPPTFPNLFIIFCAPPKSGKTNSHVYMEAIRKRVYAVIGINNAIIAGTAAGVYKNAVLCARRGGLPLHCPDEGIASVIDLLDRQPGGVRAEVFLSSGWSGADVGRAKATAQDMHTESARLTILAMGTLADVTAFHRLCKQHYSNRGLVGRFFTAYAPAYPTRCNLPEAENADEESLLMVNSDGLTQLLGDALISLYRQMETPGFRGFHFTDNALASVEALRVHESAQQEEPEEQLHWSDALMHRLLSHLRLEFRFTEMVEKWALILHLLDLACNSINFVERTISQEPLPTLIHRTTVEKAKILVERAHEQDAFFVQVLRISTATRNRDVIFVMENVDFVLYKCLRKILLMWPGPLVTSESFGDRCAKLNITISFNEVAAAGQALADLGSLTRETPSSRITCPGLFQQGKLPRQTFRWFKTHPDLVSLELLEDMGISLEDYTTRYNMDFYQIVDCLAMRSQRSEKTFNSWVDSIPASLLPREDGRSAHAETTATAEPTTSRRSLLAEPMPTFPKNSQFQHESVELRFGPALSKRPPAKKRAPAPQDPQHEYRLPGAPAFSNHAP